MRIIKRKEFLAIEGKVLYSKVYGQHKLGELFIKLGNCGDNDWVKQSIAADAVECSGAEEYLARMDTAWKGVDVPMDFDCGVRDGCYEGANVLFAVFSEEDTWKLVDALSAIRPGTAAADKTASLESVEVPVPISPSLIKTVNEIPDRLKNEQLYDVIALCERHYNPIPTFEGLELGDDKLLLASRDWWFRFVTQLFTYLDKGGHISRIIYLEGLEALARIEAILVRRIVGKVYSGMALSNMMTLHQPIYERIIGQVVKFEPADGYKELKPILKDIELLQRQFIALNDDGSPESNEIADKIYRKLLELNHCYYELMDLKNNLP